MQTGFINWFRQSKRLPSLALLLAILMPVLFGVLPVPAVSAEQQLMIDVAGNICSPFDKNGKHDGMPAGHEHHCILCGPLNHSLGAAKTPDLVITPSLVLRRIVLDVALDEAPHTRPDLRSTAPRGPPLSLTI